MGDEVKMKMKILTAAADIDCIAVVLMMGV